MRGARRVLIVGAGIAGLSLGIALRRQGIEPDIIERQDGLPPHGTGIYLLGNAMRVLRSLGIADEVLARGAPIATQTLLNRRGRRLAVVDTATFWAGCGPCVGLRRQELQDVLATSLGETHVRFSTTVATLQQRADSVVARFGDGDERAYDLVVGADGVHSSTRRQLFGDAHPRFRGQVAWRFLARCPPQITGWTLYAGRQGVFLYLPVGGGQAYCYADVEADQPFTDAPDGRLERLRSRFGDFASPVPETLAELQSPQRVHVGAIEDVQQEPWSKGQVVLIGDAAHATSPNMASGAAMALEDSAVLAQLMASAESAEQVIRAYAARRAARVAWVREQTQRRDRLRHLPPLIRDALTLLFARRVYAANYAPLLAEI